MTKYRPFQKKNKLDYIKEQTYAVEAQLANLKKIPDFQGLPAKEFYKNAKLIYDSGWATTENELIPEATAIEQGVLLPARATYNFSVPLVITEEFLPYLKVEVLAQTNPDILIEGVYEFERSAYKPVTIHTYDWLGITYTTGCQAFGDPPVSPAPADMYTQQETGFFFNYVYVDYPVPEGEDLTYVVPHPELVGYENAIGVCPQSTPPYGQYWEDNGSSTFMQLATLYGLQGAKDLIDAYYDNIVYATDELPYEALEAISETRVVTGQQVKTFIKQNEENYILNVTGDFLIISESIDETSYSRTEWPTYQPHPGDMQVKLHIYSVNPNVYSERKYYINGA